MSKHFILEPLNCWWTWHRSLLVYLFSNTKFKAQFVLSKLPLSRSPLQFPSYFVEICLIIAESTIHESFQNSRNFFTTTHNLNDSYLNRMRREQKKWENKKLTFNKKHVWAHLDASNLNELRNRIFVFMFVE